MQLNKVLKGLMIALPVMAIAACSSNKNASNDGSEGMLGAGTGMDANGGNGNMSSEEQARLQMQQLQQNNIVYFDLDKYDIRSDFAQMLDAHANFLRSNPSYKVTVEGHADERGTPEYNISLGERRANAVKMYLQGKGVSADQISIVSYGKEKPAVLGQLNYNKGKKDDAAYYFASVVKNYPKSPKAADAMFKVGVIMQDKGDTAKAKAVYQQVISKYPGTDGAKQAQKRLNAM